MIMTKPRKKLLDAILKVANVLTDLPLKER